MLRRSFVFAVALLAGAALGAEKKSAAGEWPKTFTFNDPNNRDTVSFVLEAPLETINGQTNHLTGQVTVEKDKANGELHVPVNTIRTGNDTRDGHLQSDKWLDAAKNPDIIVKFKDVKLPAPLENAKPQKIDTKVAFTIHGVTHEEPVEVMVTYLKESAETKNRIDGDILRLKAKFKIPLESYDIKTRRALVLKVGEVAEVTVDAWGSTALQLKK